MPALLTRYIDSAEGAHGRVKELTQSSGLATSVRPVMTVALRPRQVSGDYQAVVSTRAE